MNEHEFRVGPSRGWPTGVVHPSRSQPTVASVPSGAKASMSRREETEVCLRFVLPFSRLLILYLASTCLQSQPVSIHVMRPPTFHRRGTHPQDARVS